MAQLVFGMNQSLDGYVDHDKMSMEPELFRYWTQNTRNLAGSIYGTVVYGLMCYWDEDHADWGNDEREFAKVWRGQHKWVVSNSLKSVGPNATLVAGDLEAFVRDLKARLDGEIDIAGPTLAASVGRLGLIDEYRIHLRPAVLGQGKPHFVDWQPSALRLVGSEIVGADTVRATYVPA
jgi:dihydrofolate reductase